MASSEWLEIYRSYTAGELDEEILKLRKDLDGGFTGQNSGGTGHTRDLADLKNRLHAATRVRNQRSGNQQARRGVVDFGGGAGSDY